LICIQFSTVQDEHHLQKRNLSLPPSKQEVSEHFPVTDTQDKQNRLYNRRKKSNLPIEVSVAGSKTTSLAQIHPDLLPPVPSEGI
jgi:hypothetical protein